ncbi:MAG: hypothetical protein LBL08_01010 [Candidatus Nomurabacteria bacterium]|jgi:hypothetical protein|nr:hypothetical protein [Candidatus Nomurabacteria bacterium]
MYNKPNISLIVAIVLAVLTAGALGLFAWSYNEMLHYKDDTAVIVAEAVAGGKDEQQKIDETNFAEELKKPYNDFVGPKDFGSVSFEYPKTWAAYNVKNDKASYEVVFYPKLVPPLADETIMALRVFVENKDYEETVKSFDAAAENGELTVKPITLGKTKDFDGFKGVRLDGKISEKLKGAFVLFEIRDKTLTVRVDSQDFMSDFDNIILPSLKFAQ